MHPFSRLALLAVLASVILGLSGCGKATGIMAPTPTNAPTSNQAKLPPTPVGQPGVPSDQ